MVCVYQPGFVGVNVMLGVVAELKLYVEGTMAPSLDVFELSEVVDVGGVESVRSEGCDGAAGPRVKVVDNVVGRLIANAVDDKMSPMLVGALLSLSSPSSDGEGGEGIGGRLCVTHGGGPGG